MSPTPPSEFVFAPPPPVSVAVSGSALRFAVRRIYCVGRNYADHVREMGGDEREPPFFFQKPTDAIVLGGSEVPYPPYTQDFQHEVELVLAIGASGSNISAQDAAQHVFAVTVGIDLTRRDVQIEARKTGRPWEVGKSFDHSAACATLLPLSGGPLPGRGAIELRVNDVVRQSGDLTLMIWSCAEIVSKLSAQYRLMAGDLIYTGTPAGVGPLQAGDLINASVAGIGEISLRIVDGTE